jgi:hypothetical protein
VLGILPVELYRYIIQIPAYNSGPSYIRLSPFTHCVKQQIIPDTMEIFFLVLFDVARFDQLAKHTLQLSLVMFKVLNRQIGIVSQLDMGDMLPKGLGLGGSEQFGD